MIIKLTGKDSEQAFNELLSNIEYDSLECKVEVVKAQPPPPDLPRYDSSMYIRDASSDETNSGGVVCDQPPNP